MLPDHVWHLREETDRGKLPMFDRVVAVRGRHLGRSGYVSRQHCGFGKPGRGTTTNNVFSDECVFTKLRAPRRPLLDTDTSGSADHAHAAPRSFLARWPATIKAVVEDVDDVPHPFAVALREVGWDWTRNAAGPQYDDIRSATKVAGIPQQPAPRDVYLQTLREVMLRFGYERYIVEGGNSWNCGAGTTGVERY